MEHRCSPYKEAQTQFIEYLDKEVFGKYLINPKQVPLNEVFCYDDSRSISPYIKGSMKASIHSGLTNPSFYCEVRVFYEKIGVEFKNILDM